MPRHLLILRHAKSAWDTDAATDFERPLAKRGRKSARRVGRWVRHQGVIPDYVVSSPARRAKQTVTRVCRVLGVKAKRIHWDARIYGADTQSLLDVLADCPKRAKTVLLAGHNPGLEELLRHLCSSHVETPPDGKLLPTAAIAHVRMPKSWKALKAGQGRVLSITRPVRPETNLVAPR